MAVPIAAAGGTAAAGFLASAAGKSIAAGTGLKAASGLATGIGNIAAARQMRLSPEEERELEELIRLREAGQLGLTEAQEGRLEQQFAMRRGGLMRQQQATALQQAAAAGPVSGRDVFLREQARQQEAITATQQENILRAQQEAEAAVKQEQRLASLKEQEKQAKIAMSQAVAGTVAGVLGAPVEPLQQYGLLSATGKISPYAGVSEEQILNTSLGLDEDELDPGIILGG